MQPLVAAALEVVRMLEEPARHVPAAAHEGPDAEGVSQLLLRTRMECLPANEAGLVRGSKHSRAISLNDIDVANLERRLPA